MLSMSFVDPALASGEVVPWKSRPLVVVARKAGRALDALVIGPGLTSQIPSSERS